MAWRTDACEPGTLTLNRVVPGSPAGNAGLATGDRITAWRGQPVSDPEAFFQALQTAKEVPLTIERDGRLRQVTIRPATASN